LDKEPEKDVDEESLLVKRKLPKYMYVLRKSVLKNIDPNASLDISAAIVKNSGGKGKKGNMKAV
jgi:hypothetical protein